MIAIRATGDETELRSYDSVLLTLVYSVLLSVLSLLLWTSLAFTDRWHALELLGKCKK